MRPVYSYDRRAGGDCFRAAIASILEMNPVNVPHALAEGGCDGDRAFAIMESFLNERDLSLYRYAICALEFADLVNISYNRRRSNFHYIIVSGNTENNICHCVIVADGEVVHNPTPGLDIVGPCDDGSFQVDIIVPKFLSKRRVAA